MANIALDVGNALEGLGNAIGGLFGNNTSSTSVPGAARGSNLLANNGIPISASTPQEVANFNKALGIPAPANISGTVTNNAAPAATSSTGSTGSTGLGGTSLNAPGYIAGIQQEYGSQINAAPTTQTLYSQGQSGQIAGIQGSATAQQQQQQAQANSQLGTLGTEQNTTQAQQNLSLSELAAQIRAQNQGLGAQLGAAGAGSSSAVGMGQLGLAQEQNTDRANIQQQTAGNVANIQSQEAGVNSILSANLASIDQWKNSQISNVSNQYALLNQQLNTAVSTAQGEEKARLAEFGQSLTDSAVQSLANINSTAQQAVSSLQAQQQSVTPNLTNVPNAQAVNPIQVNTVSPFQISGQNTNGNATAPTGAPAGGSLDALLQQQQQNSATS